MSYHERDRNDQPVGEALHDPEAFAGVVRALYNRIYLVALSLTRHHEMSEEITQETFLRVWLKRDLVWGPNVPLQPWLVRIARNLATDWLRSGQTHSRVLPLVSLEELTMELPDPRQKNPRDAVSTTEEHAQLTAAVMAMPDDLRQVVLLHYAEGMSASDIARISGEAPSTVTRRLERARTRLRKHLHKGFADGLATMKPGSASLQKTLGILTIATGLSEASQAQILRLIDNTPPPPMIDPVQPTAKTAIIKETGNMKTIIAKTGAAKLLTTTAAAGVIAGGGYFAVNSLQQPVNSNAASSSDRETVSVNRLAITDTPVSVVTRSSGPRNSETLRTDKAAQISPAVKKERWLEHQHRIKTLKSDLISTHPELVMLDGHTTESIRFNIEVVNDSGLPVQNATIKIPQYGFVEEWGSGYVGRAMEEWGDFRTNQQGIARVSVPAITMEEYPTRRVNIQATHPDYASTSEDMHLTSVTKVVMQPGMSIEVIATDANSSAPIVANVTPDITANFPKTTVPDWFQRPDGTVVIRKIDSDKLRFHLTHETRDGRVLISDYVTITFPRATNEPLYVPLKPTYTLAGRLSDNVPRPVKDMKLEAAYAFADPESDIIMVDDLQVNPDGTFEIPGLPANAQVFINAFGDGFFSEIDNTDDSVANSQAYNFIMKPGNGQIELPMLETATVIAKVVDKDGRPIANAGVYCGTSLCRRGHCVGWSASLLVASTNETGVAVIHDLPAVQQMALSMVDGWKLAGENVPDRREPIAPKPGETLEVTLTAYPE